MPAEFNWEDPLDLESQLTEDERMIRDAARAFCNDKLAPRVKQAFRDENPVVEVQRHQVSHGAECHEVEARRDRLAGHVRCVATSQSIRGDA